MQNNESSLLIYSIPPPLPEKLTIYSLALGPAGLGKNPALHFWMHDTTEGIYGIFEMLCNFMGEKCDFFFKGSFSTDEIKHSWQLRTL